MEPRENNQKIRKALENLGEKHKETDLTLDTSVSLILIYVHTHTHTRRVTKGVGFSMMCG